VTKHDTSFPGGPRQWYFVAVWRAGAILLVSIACWCLVSAALATGSVIDGLILEQNYPNPFSSMTEIQYVIPSNGHVLLRVFNTLGQEVGRPVDDDKTANRWIVKFDGSTLPSGQYTYTLVFTPDVGETGAQNKTSGKLIRKMYLLR
jgi:hypothetical protein